MSEFRAFPKIPRLRRGMIVTEKIDGTNACVVVAEGKVVAVQSRSRNITPASDNYGFAAWVEANQEQLGLLGDGYHYGEWWGAGIQRRYGLDHKRFSLFNTHRPHDSLPPGVHQVPVLYKGDFSTAKIDELVAQLAAEGSRAAPGFADPEGVVVYLPHARELFKVTCKNDAQPKGQPADE